VTLPASHFGGNNDILIDGFVPPLTSVAPMFPFFENTAEWDDFGEVINPDDYMMKQEEMDNTLMLVSLLIHPCGHMPLESLKLIICKLPVCQI
jgi:hypothetical protein